VKKPYCINHDQDDHTDRTESGALKKEEIMKTTEAYTEVIITPHHSGFGMWERGELQIGPETSFAFKGDLLFVIGQNSDKIAPIAEAIEDADFIELGIEDIRGRIYNQPDEVFARISDGELSYFGIEETIVQENFWL
jgi:hypothetical protein